MNGKRKHLLTVAALLLGAAIFHVFNDETVARKGGGKGKPPAGLPAISFSEHVPGRAIKTVDLQSGGETTLVSGQDVIGTQAR